MSFTRNDGVPFVVRHDVGSLLQVGGNECEDFFLGRLGRVLSHFGYTLGDLGDQGNVPEHLDQFKIEQRTQEQGFSHQLVAQFFVFHLVQVGNGHIGAADAGVPVGPETVVLVQVDIHQVLQTRPVLVVLTASCEHVVRKELSCKIVGVSTVCKHPVEGGVHPGYHLDGIVCRFRIVTGVFLGVAIRVKESFTTRKQQGSKCYE